MSRFGREWSLGAKNVSIFPFLCATLYISEWLSFTQLSVKQHGTEKVG
jgi:hypothetical protein